MSDDSMNEDTAVMNDDTIVSASLLDEPVDDDGLTELLASRAPRRGFPKVTAALVGAALVAGGFIGGVQVEKHNGSTSGAAGRGAAAFASGAAGAGGAGAAGAAGRNFRSFGGGGGAGGSVSGTVKLIQGTTIYVQETNGNIATVTTSGTTTVQVSSKSSLSALTPGTTVTVQGSAGSDGSVTATSITASGATGQ